MRRIDFVNELQVPALPLLPYWGEGEEDGETVFGMALLSLSAGFGCGGDFFLLCFLCEGVDWPSALAALESLDCVCPLMPVDVPADGSMR